METTALNAELYDYTSLEAKTAHEHSATFHSQHPSDGRSAATIHFRKITPEDEEHLHEFFESHTPETIHSRYGMSLREMTHKRALQLVCLDGYKELALVGLVSLGDEEHIVAVGRYALDTQTNLAEVAFVVHEAYRGMGIATHLLGCLVAIIHAKGFAGITAQTLLGNTHMLHTLNRVLGHADQTEMGCGEIVLNWRFTSPL